MSIWDEAELVEEPKTKSIWDEAELVEEPTKPARTYASQEWQKVGEQNPEEFKKNIDKIYDIPQVEMPKQGTLTNSDGNIKKGESFRTFNPSVNKQAEIDRIKQEYEARNREIDKQHWQGMGRIGFGTALQGASMLPIFNIPYVGTGIGGAMFDAGGAIMEGVKAKDIAKKAAEGFVIGETLGAIPYVGKFAGKTKIGSAIGSKMTNTAKAALESKLGQRAQRVLAADIIPKVSPKITKEVQAEILTPEAVRQIERDSVNMPQSEFKESRLPKGADLPPEIEQAVNDLPPEYQVLHNRDLINQAEQEIQNEGISDTASLLRQQKNYSALDFEKARQTIQRLYNEGKTEEALELTDIVARKGSEAGQAVQAMSLWKKTTPDGAVKQAQKIIREYNENAKKPLPTLTEEQALEVRKLAENIQNASEGREKDIATAQLMKYFTELTPQSWNKKYDTFRYMNMLLSPKSRIKDFLLTGINSADKALDTVIANGIDKIRTLIPGQQRVFSGLHSNEWTKGFGKGFKEGVEDVKLGIDTARSGEFGRYGVPKTQAFKFKPVFGQKWESLSNNPLSNTVNNILAAGEKGLNYSLQVPDRAFYEAQFQASLADQMAAAGIKEPTNEMIKQATKEALEAVYQDNSWVSKLGNATRTGINDITGNFEQTLGLKENALPRLGDFLAPFVTTPANIANIGLKNTFGATPGLIKLRNATTAGEVRDAEMLIAQNIKGILPFGIGAAIGAKQLESNIGEDNYTENEITGLKPQSIVFGDKAISLQNYPQWSIPMSIGSGLVQGGPSQAIMNTGKAIADMPALKALGDLVNTTQSGFNQELTGDQILNNILRSQGANLLTQNIAFGGLLGELRNDIDPYARELNTPNTGEYLKNRVINRLPFVSQTLPIKYNAIGEPVYTNNIQNPGFRTLSEAVDFGVRNYNEEPVYNTFEQLKNDIKDTDITGKTSVGFKKVPRTIKINNQKVQLDNEQYSRYQHEFGKLNSFVKKNLLNDPVFTNMSLEEQVNEINDWRRSVDEAVKMQLFGYTPSKRVNNYTRFILSNYDDLMR